jgi:hypothetical protein
MSIIVSDLALQALIDAGVVEAGGRRTRRVIIDLQAGYVPIIHTERYGDDTLLNLVRALGGVEITHVPNVAVEPLTAGSGDRSPASAPSRDG